MMGHIGDRKLLLTMRLVTLTFTVMVTLYAINSRASIFKMVENAYQITLVMAFVPLVGGLFWKKATNQGALLSILLGFGVWISTLVLGPEDPFLPAQFAGVVAGAVGMMVGSLMPAIKGLEPKQAHRAGSHSPHAHDAITGEAHGKAHR